MSSESRAKLCGASTRKHSRHEQQTEKQITDSIRWNLSKTSLPLKSYKCFRIPMNSPARPDNAALLRMTQIIASDGELEIVDLVRTPRQGPSLTLYPEN